QQHRVQGAPRRLRGDAGLLQDPRHDPGPGGHQRDQETGGHRGHADPSHGRPYEVKEWHYNSRRSVEGDRGRPLAASVALRVREEYMVSLRQLLDEMIKMRASDLHISAGVPPQVRIDGSILPMAHPPLTPQLTQQLAYSVLTEEQRKRFETT